ncbi:hypothetical protein ANTQUA_LOCUS10335 [Anthophora quadrimaculata]
MAGGCVRAFYNRSPHRLGAGGPHVLPDQCRPAGPALPANRGRPVAGHRPIRSWASVPPARNVNIFTEELEQKIPNVIITISPRMYCRNKFTFFNIIRHL